MTLEQNIMAILESYFSGFKDELIEACAKRITEQVERQANTPQTDCKTCEYSSKEKESDECYTCSKYYNDNYVPQTERSE